MGLAVGAVRVRDGHRGDSHREGPGTTQHETTLLRENSVPVFPVSLVAIRFLMGRPACSVL